MPTYLQASGAISMSDINSVFGRGNDLNSYRGTTWYTAAGGSGTFSSGAISMSDFYSKGPTAPNFTATISSSQNKLNLRDWAVANGWNGSLPATITLGSGVYIYSDDINTAALTINGSWPGGLTFVNNGYVMGMGGHGGGYRENSITDYASNVDLQAGGPAISMGVSCTIQNNSYIGGGGGGGAGVICQSGSYIYGQASVCGGGGAGGGVGGGGYNGAAPGTLALAGGAGGAAGSNGSNGQYGVVLVYTGTATGGGGGRIMPGTRTSTPSVSYGNGSATAGYGGEGGVAGSNQSLVANTSTTAGSSSVGGYGGSAGGAGGAYVGTYTYGQETAAGGGGGGWGASGGTARAISSGSYPADATTSGASGGKCINLNGYTITWSATGTRYGGIS